MAGQPIKYTRIRGIATKTISKPRTNVSIIKSIKSVPGVPARKQIIHRRRQILSTKERLNRKTKPVIGQLSSDLDGFKDSRVGKIGIIVGNGPSHKEAQLDDLLNIDNIEFMSINKPDERIWPTPLWCFCDNSQHRRHTALWETYTGLLCNSSAVKAQKPGSLRVKSLSGYGFSQSLPKGCYIGRSSCYAAMQIALWLGYDHIYMFGVDMGTDKSGKLYPWGSNPDVSDEVRIKRFDTEAKWYQWAADNLHARIRAKYTFCSSYNKYKFLEQFESIGHMEAIELIKNRHVGKGA